MNMTINKYHKEREYSAPRGYGAWTPNRLMKSMREVSNGTPNAARPYPYFSFIERFKQAWDVFTYRADALYWQENTPDLL